MKFSYTTVAIAVIFLIIVWRWMSSDVSVVPEEIKDLSKLNKVVVYNLDSVPCLLPYQHSAPTVIQFFDTGCLLCHEHIADLVTRIGKFDSITFIFVTPESRNSVRQYFSKLSLPSNAHVVIMPLETLLNTFGDIAPPKAYIYNRNGELWDVIDGKFNIEVISEKLVRATAQHP